MATTKATPNVVLTGSDTIYDVGSVSGAVTIDFSRGLAQTISLSGDATFTFTNWPSGWHSTAELYITGNGHAVTWPAEVTWLPANAATLLASGATLVILSTLDGDPVWARSATAAVDAGKAEVIQVALSDISTALTAGTLKDAIRMPFAMTVSEVRASLTTAQVGGSIFTVDINEAGTSILSTKLTIDNTEKTSTTAATPAVISDANLADDAEISFDIDQVGDGTAKGLKVTIIGRRA